MVWDTFWKDKGKAIEWNKSDILKSQNLRTLSEYTLRLLNKKTLNNLASLELGSGLGLTSFYLANRGVKVTLLDMSKEAKSKALNYWHPEKPKFIIADLFKFRPDKKYDIVSSFGLCEHFIGEKRKEVLKKHLEVLKKGGVIIISVPHRYGIFYRLQKVISESLGLWSFGVEVPFSREELKKFAEKNKLTYKIICTGFWSSFYDLFIRKPFKLLGISTKRRFEELESIFDYYFGSGIILIAKKESF